LDRHQRKRRALHSYFLPWTKGVGELNSGDPFFSESALCRQAVLDWIADV